MSNRRAAAQPEIAPADAPKPGMLTPFTALDRRIWLLALARCINTMGFSLVMPFMAMHLVEDRGATGALYGAIYLVGGLVAALGQGISGELSDRIGRRKVMVSGLAARAVNLAALGFAVLESSPIWVIVSRRMVGMTKKNRAPRNTIGIQKPLSSRSCLMSDRATIAIRRRLRERQLPGLLMSRCSLRATR